MAGETSIELIMKERIRQIEEEGWSLEHDDNHVNEELAEAAAFYCIPEKYGEMLVFWPWEEQHKKREYSRFRQLVVAGALIAAELDRLIRAGYED